LGEFKGGIFGNEIQLAISQPVLQAISGISVVQKFF